MTTDQQHVRRAKTTAKSTAGSFAAQARVETNEALAPETPASAKVDVEDGGGDWIEITPGVIDEDAEWVYLHGQCLALAVAASRRTGWPVVLHTFEDEDDWDGDEPTVYDNLRHAYVQRPDGALIDIMGARWGDEGALVDSLNEGERLRTVPASDTDRVLAEFDGYLVPQDVETAATFVQPMLDLAGETEECQNAGAPAGEGWSEQVSPYTGLVTFTREFDVVDGRATHSVSGVVPGEQPQQVGDALRIGSGSITIAQGDRLPGELTYTLLDAPLTDEAGRPTGERAKAVYVNWVEVQRNKGKGWASAMYAAIREAHPDCVIPAAAELEPPGKRLVKHYREKHPEVHTGRFDTAYRVRPTTGPNDALYRRGQLAAVD